MEKHLELPYKVLLNKFAKGEVYVPFGTNLVNCVAYYRVSSKEQFETNNSLEWQQTICEKYAKENNLIIKSSFGGTYESAKTDERKEFDRMLRFITQCKKEKISFILVHCLDRFSRTGGNAIYIKDKLNKTGVHIVSATQPMDSRTHSGAFQQNIHFIFSKYENDIRTQKSVDGMRAKLMRGEWLGNCPVGYSYDKTKTEQTIIINDQGPLIDKAFHMRVDGFTYDEIIAFLRLNGLHLYKQHLSKIFRNPFYIGFISHNFLNGELVRGKHPALITEEVFLKANQLCKTDNFKQKKVNDDLPLKGFVSDFESHATFTGYLAKKKGLYYYKANRPGVNVNRSQIKMHELFTKELNKLCINKEYWEAMRMQLTLTWNSLTEDKRGEKITYNLKLKEIDEKLNKLEERYAFGEINSEIYSKFSEPLKKEKGEISEAILEYDFELSNHKELIDYSLRLSSNAASIWQSGDYFHKQRFQRLVFPSGIYYDARNDEYRTFHINVIFMLNAHISRALEEQKKRDFSDLTEKSPLVPRRRLELHF
jgi:site-specific DNA recombinase